MKMTNLERRVERGAAWLDKHYEGWVGRVDLEMLNQSNQTH